MEKKWKLIQNIIDQHPHCGVEKGWSWYTGGMKDTGGWFAGKLMDASIEELQEFLDKIVEEKSKLVVLLSGEDLEKSKIIHSMGEWAKVD